MLNYGPSNDSKSLIGANAPTHKAGKVQIDDLSRRARNKSLQKVNLRLIIIANISTRVD